MKISIVPRAARVVALVALLSACISPLLADRLHLENGGHIDVDRWWVDGDTLMYEALGGTVGIPRSVVTRIESDGRHSPPGRAPTFNQSPPRPGGSVDSRDTAEIRETLRRAHGALEQRDYELASSYYLFLIQETPELYVARVGYAMSEIALGRDGLALSIVLDGIAHDPERPELHELLGELRYREDRLDDALRAWRHAFELEPNDRLRDRIVKVERELNTSRDYDFASSSHFNLRYDGSIDLDLASDMIDYLEQQYWIITEIYRHAPARPITIQLYPERDFREVTQAPEWVGGLYDGKIRLPLGGLTRLNTDAKRVLVHELTHAVVHSKSRGSAPRWLQEGLAQVAEDKSLLRSQFRAIAELLDATPEQRWDALPFSYEIALSLTRYLEARRSLDHLIDVVKWLGEGESVDDALRRVYGRDYAGVCKDWGREVLTRYRR